MSGEQGAGEQGAANWKSGMITGWFLAGVFRRIP